VEVYQLLTIWANFVDPKTEHSILSMPFSSF